MKLDINVERQPLPDMIVVGLQEVHVSPKNLFKLSSSDDWSKRLQNALYSSGYVKIARHRMQGMVILAFGKPEFTEPLANIKESSVATGINGWFGNKGGVGVSFEYNGKKVALINAHFHPHDNMYESRLNDFHQISSRMKFKLPVLKHDLVYWFGDLNFRIDQFTIEEVLRLVNDPNNQTISHLLKHDQLNRARREGQAFAEFVEMPISFLPSYKFQNPNDEYSYQRKPAFTDRILYKLRHDDTNHSAITVKQENYDMRREFSTSDHKPVSALFLVDFDGPSPAPPA